MIISHVEEECLAETVETVIKIAEVPTVNQHSTLKFNSICR